jgi:hypothetical protein
VRNFSDFLKGLQLKISKAESDLPYGIKKQRTYIIYVKSRDSSGGWATGWTMRDLRFDSWRELGIFLFTTASRTALIPTQLPMQCLPGALSLGVERPGREAD